MFKILTVLVLLNVRTDSTLFMNKNSENSSDILIDQLKQWEPHQITLFRNNGHTLGDHRTINKLASRIPIGVVNLSVKSQDKFSYLSRDTTIFVIDQLSQDYDESIDLDRVKFNLNFTIEYVEKAIRPRTLMIFSNNNPNDRRNFEKILNHAWHNKFLDFTILNLNRRNESKIYQYDPFTSSYDIKSYHFQVNLFPDKVRNVNQYETRIPYIRSTPYMVQSRHDNTSYSGTEFDIIKFINQALNFKLVMIDYRDGYSAISNAVNDLETGIVNMLPFTLFIAHPLIYNMRKTERGHIFLFDGFTGLTKTITARKSDLDVYFSVMLGSLIVIVSVILVVFLLDYLMIMKNPFSPFDTFQIILRGSGVKQPNNTSDRIIFLSIVIVSMTYFEDIFAALAESRISDVYVPVKSFKDIIKLKLAPYVSEGNYPWIFDHHDKLLAKIKLYTRTGHTGDCVRLILDGENNICLAFNSKAEMYVRKFRDQDGLPRFNMAEIKFLTQGKSIIFEKASPFVDKFNKMSSRIVEAGMLQFWHNERTYKGYTVESTRATSNSNSESSFLILQLCLIFGIGIVVSTILLLWELAHHHTGKVINVKLVF